jgi:hypothetical protein
MSETFTEDLVDFLSDREDDLMKIFVQQFQEEEHEFSVEFDDYSR